jgi:predicted Zn-dependent protease
MEIEGSYLDGQTAQRHRVIIHPTRNGLEITTEKGTKFFWPFEEIRQDQHFGSEGEIRLEKGGNIPEVLFVPGSLFLSSLKWAAPEVVKHFHDPARRRFRTTFTILAALTVVGITALLYLWGIPGLANLAASRVPVSWEEHLGQAIVDQLAPPERRCSSPDPSRVMEEIIARLAGPLSANPYRFRIIVLENPAVNALAAPGGFIIVFGGLLEQTHSAEELAGVLAHEMQHILQRHSTQAIFEQASTSLLAAAIIGDTSGAMAFGLEGARTLGALRYSRRHEEEADAGAMAMMMAAGVDPAGYINFFKKIKNGEKGSLRLPVYLSSHPDLEGRIDRLALLARGSPHQPTKLLAKDNWSKIQEICKTRGMKPSG